MKALRKFRGYQKRHEVGYKRCVLLDDLLLMTSHFLWSHFTGGKINIVVYSSSMNHSLNIS